jgi:hypothetical protein
MDSMGGRTLDSQWLEGCIMKRRMMGIVGTCLLAAQLSYAGVTVEVEPGVSVGSGLTSYTVNLIADSPADEVAAFDGGFSGAMNQVGAFSGALPTPTLDNVNAYLTPTEKSQDSHFLFLIDQLVIETAPAETASSLTGVFGVKVPDRAESLEFAQIVLADGDSVELTGTASNGAGDAFDVSTVIPEPATMSLLGLGALAIIRRRRKQQ